MKKLIGISAAAALLVASGSSFAAPAKAGSGDGVKLYVASSLAQNLTSSQVNVVTNVLTHVNDFLVKNAKAEFLAAVVDQGGFAVDYKNVKTEITAKDIASAVASANQEASKQAHKKMVVAASKGMTFAVLNILDENQAPVAFTVKQTGTKLTIMRAVVPQALSMELKKAKAEKVTTFTGK